jgi:hypothetical protein
MRRGSINRSRKDPLPAGIRTTTPHPCTPSELGCFPVADASTARDRRPGSVDKMVESDVVRHRGGDVRGQDASSAEPPRSPGMPDCPVLRRIHSISSKPPTGEEGKQGQCGDEDGPEDPNGVARQGVTAR